MTKSLPWKLFAWALVAVALAAVLTTAPAMAAEDPVTVKYGSEDVKFRINVNNEGTTLEMTGPKTINFSERFERGDDPIFSLYDRVGKRLPDGIYSWEVRIVPYLDEGYRDALNSARKQGDTSLFVKLCDLGLLSEYAQTGTGSFQLLDGELVDDRIPEPNAPKAASGDQGAGSSHGQIRPGFSEAPSASPDAGLKQLISGNLSVHNSACVGFDCLANETYGFDTIKLKENNLRIKFEDTSVNSFPSNDWELTANDSANGGANRFSIRDVSGARNLFTVTAGAPNNALVVDSQGDVGIGTATATTELHIVDGDTPTVRLEQDGSSGFAPQTWDVAGNETSFFIRDATNGSTLPFRIRPGAPSQALVIGPTGAVGIGVLSPVDTGGNDVGLHIRRTNGEAQLFVEEDSTTETARNLLDLENNGIVQMRFMDDSPNGDTWQFSNGDGGFNISKQGSGALEFDIRDTGDIFVSGTMVHASSRTMKTNFSPVDSQDVLTRINQLPITAWNYKRDIGTRHIGPMAEDFYEAFGLGTDAQHIAVSDSAGVALAAIQALNRKLETELEAKAAVIRSLEERLTALESQTP